MIRKSVEPNMVTYFHTVGRKNGTPVAGTFEITAQCNFNCPMCYVHMSEEEIRKSGKELTAEQWLSIAKKARDRGMIFALLTGGEPFVRKDFFEIYKGMKELGLVVSINSNGSMLRGSILEKLLADPPFRINISLYGGSNDTYRNMCGIPAYDQVKENIRKLRAAGIEVSLNLSITPFNCKDIGRIYQDACDLNVNVRASSYMYPPIRINGEEYGTGNRLSAEDAALYSVEWDILRFTPEEFAIRAENTAKLICNEPEGCSVDEGDGVRCRAGSTSFWMTWDGKMLPCGMMTEPVVYPLEVGFDNAWDSIREQTSRIRTPAECVTCDHREVCANCAAVCYAETGTFDAVPSYVCKKTREQVRITVEKFNERKQL